MGCVVFAVPPSLKYESAIASFALARYSLSGYVLISVCKFRRTTSCRPCLMSAIALSYRILSGSAVLSALVDLLTFFFLCNGHCALLGAALSSINPPAISRVNSFAPTLEQVTCTPHLSCESRITTRPTAKAVHVRTFHS